jgi:cytochrome c peroxidase
MSLTATSRIARAVGRQPFVLITIACLMCIATFEQIVSGTAPFGRWLRGDDGAMSADAQHGFELFNSKAQCSTCHSGWRFTDDSFHDIWVPGAARVGLLVA